MKIKADHINMTAQLTLSTLSPQYAFLIQQYYDNSIIEVQQFPNEKFIITSVNTWTNLNGILMGTFNFCAISE